jgi:hypothetical protein
MRYFVQKYKNPMGNDCECFFGKEENSNAFGIASDEMNIDTQAFRAWLAEGNTPEEWIDE